MTHSFSNQQPLALIIEDDDEQLYIFSQALEMAEFETEVIKDGLTAMDRLAEVEPAVVVLDLHLPGISGRAILDYIRSEARLADTRVILATADFQTANLLRPASDLVLLKPISFIQLKELASRIRPKDTMTIC